MRVLHSILDPDDLPARFGLAGACRLLHHGHNDTYELRTTAGEFVARIVRHGWRTRAQVEAELAVLRHLSAEGVPVSAPVAGPVDIDAPEGVRLAVLFPKAPGNIPHCLDDETCDELGSTLGRMHRVLDDWRGPERLCLDLDFLVGASLDALVASFPERSAELDELRGRFARLGDRVSHAGLARGWLHGDFINANVFWSPKLGVTIFDFDFCGTGWRAYDVATFRWGLQVAQAGEADALFARFLDAYEAEMERIDRDALDDLVTIRHLWVWAIDVAHGESFRRLNPLSFEHRLLVLLARPA